MSRVESITVKYARKFNMGNFQTADLEVTLVASRDEGEDPAAAIAKLQDQARDAVRNEYRRLAAAQQAAPAASAPQAGPPPQQQPA